MVVLRDYHDGRDFAEEDVRFQFPMGAMDLPLARRFPEIGKVDWRNVDFTRFSKTRNPKCPSEDFLIPLNHLDSMEPILIRGGAYIVDGQEPGEVRPRSLEISERPD